MEFQIKYKSMKTMNMIQKTITGNHYRKIRNTKIWIKIALNKQCTVAVIQILRAGKYYFHFELKKFKNTPHYNAYIMLFYNKMTAILLNMQMNHNGEK